MKNTTKQFNIFDFIKAIIDTKPEWNSFTPDQQKQFNNYMINKFLSMNPKYIEIVNYVQGLNIKESRRLYEVYRFMIPQSKNTYSPYIKSSTKKSLPELLKHIAEHFECSTKEAEEYIQLMDSSWTKDILTNRGIDEKEIKKLVK